MEQVRFLEKVSVSRWPLFVLAFTLPICSASSQNTMPRRGWINDARNSGLSSKPTTVDTARTDCHMSTQPPHPRLWMEQMLSYFIPQQVRPYGLSGNAGFSFHWINSPRCLLFCSVLTYSFIHNGMCIVVSGCLVIVIQLETEHILNKQKLIRLILFPFFFPKHTTLSPSNCEMWAENDCAMHHIMAFELTPCHQIIMALH